MIRADGLTKRFESKGIVVDAVRGVDLDVSEGELVAVLGPNGAGKSTTLRMLTTLLAPTSGAATVAGIDVTRDPVGVRRKIGFIGQGNGAGHHFRVIDELVSQGRFYGLGGRRARARADELLETLQLTDLAARTASTLSGGQRRRLDIAMGLMNTPSVLFLDEPTTGLDPQNRANLWAYLQTVRERSGATIVLTTHYLEEADAMAERVLIIDHGRIIADDTAAALKRRLADDTVTIAVPADQREAAVRATAAASGDVTARTDGDRATLMIAVDGADRKLPALLIRLREEGVDVLGASMRQPTLDDVFLGLTGRSLREEGAAA